MEESERSSGSGPPGSRHGGKRDGPSDRQALDKALERARAGDEDAFIGLLDWVRPEARNLAALRLRDEDDVADTVQEASLQAWQHIAAFTGDAAKFRAWVMTIVRNACRMLLRREVRAPEAASLSELGDGAAGCAEAGYAEEDVELEVWELLADSGPTPDEILEEDDYSDMLVEAVRGIDEPFATSLFLFCWGFTYAEIADMTKAKLGTVATRIERARGMARDYLRRHALVDVDLETIPRHLREGAGREPAER
jgi:RNA polymerase sigma-70 factor (ECF subfamily)